MTEAAFKEGKSAKKFFFLWLRKVLLLIGYLVVKPVIILNQNCQINAKVRLLKKADQQLNVRILLAGVAPK